MKPTPEERAAAAAKLARAIGQVHALLAMVDRFAEMMGASATCTGGSDEVVMHHLRQTRGLPLASDAKLLLEASAALLAMSEDLPGVS